MTGVSRLRLFPEKKGRIYGRSGRAVQPDRGAILLDAAL